MSVYICRGTNRKFIARYRASGERRWHCVGRPRMTMASAAMMLAKTMADKPWARFGEVIMTSDYYEPEVVFEAKR